MSENDLVVEELVWNCGDVSCRPSPFRDLPPITARSKLKRVLSADLYEYVDQLLPGDFIPCFDHEIGKWCLRVSPCARARILGLVSSYVLVDKKGGVRWVRKR